MPNMKAMHSAINSFSSILLIELLDFCKRVHPRTSQQFAEQINLLEQQYLISTLEKHLDSDEYKPKKVLSWRDLASAYNAVFQKVLQSLLDRAKQDYHFNFQFPEILEMVVHQHSFRNLRKYLETARNPPETMNYVKAQSVESFADAPIEEKKNYYPITDADLAPFQMPFPNETLTFDLSKINGKEIFFTLGILLRTHHHRAKHNELLLTLTAMLAKSPAYRCEKKLLELLEHCRRTDGCIADYTEETSLTKWFLMLHDLFFGENQKRSIFNDPDLYPNYFELLFHELKFWTPEICKPFASAFATLGDDARMGLLLNFIKKSNFFFQRRETQLSCAHLFHQQTGEKYVDQLWIPNHVTESINRLYLLLRPENGLELSAKCAAEVILCFGSVTLLDRANLIPEEIMSQQVKYLQNNPDNFDSSHERKVLEFLGLIKKTSSLPYVFKLLKTHAFLLKRPNVIREILTNHMLCKTFATAKNTKSDAAEIFANLVTELAMLDANDFARVLSTSKSQQIDYQQCIELILQDQRIKERIELNKLLAQECVASNISTQFSLILIRSGIFNSNDLVFLLHVEKSGKLVKALLEQIRALALLAQRNNEPELSASHRINIDLMLRAREAFVDKDKCVGLPAELINEFSRFYETPNSIAVLLEAEKENYITTHLPLITALLNDETTLNYFKRDLMLDARPLSRDLLTLLTHLDSETLWRLLQNDQRLQARIVAEPQLAKLAIKRDIHPELTKVVLTKFELSHTELSEFIVELKVGFAQQELLKLLAQNIFSVPISLLNALLLKTQNKKSVLEVVDVRYRDVEHIRLLIKLVPGDELVLLSCLFSSRIMIESIIQNIELADVLKWILNANDTQLWFPCFSNCLVPMLHNMLKKKDSAPVKSILKQIINKHSSELQLIECISKDSELRSLVDFDDIAMILKSIDVASLASYIEDLDFTPDQAAGILTKSKKMSDPNFEALIYSLLGIYDSNKLSTKIIEALKFKVINSLKESEHVRYQLALIRRLEALQSHKINDQGFKGIFTNGKAKMFKGNVEILELNIEELFSAKYCIPILLETELTDAQLKIALKCASKKNLLTDEILLEVLQLHSWTISQMELWVEYALADRLKQLACKLDESGRDWALLRILLTQINSATGLDRAFLNKEEREYLLGFLARKCNDYLFAHSNIALAPLFEKVTKLIVAQKKCSHEEMTAMLSNFPELPVAEYNELKPSVDVNDKDYFAKLLKIPVGAEIAGEIIDELIHKCKISEKLDAVLTALPDVDPAYVARGMFAYQERKRDRSSTLLIREVSEAQLLKLKALIGELLHFDSRFKYHSKPHHCYELSNIGSGKMYYVDHKWLQPLWDIDKLINLEREILRGRGWLISDLRPYEACPPAETVATAVPQHMPLPDCRLEEIFTILKKAKQPASPDQSPLLQRRESQPQHQH